MVIRAKYIKIFTYNLHVKNFKILTLTIEYLYINSFMVILQIDKIDLPFFFI